MRLKVLSIDDDLGMTELLGLLLRGYGFDVISANTSELGLQLAHNEKPNIITLDLMMPGIDDGWKLCKAIRSFSKVPIIILSALDDATSIATGLAAGADDYLVKPVSGDVLAACIKKFTYDDHPNDNNPTNSA